MPNALSPFMSLTFIRQNTASVCTPTSNETSASRRANHENLVTVLPPARSAVGQYVTFTVNQY